MYDPMTFQAVDSLSWLHVLRGAPPALAAIFAALAARDRSSSRFREFDTLLFRKKEGEWTWSHIRMGRGQIRGGSLGPVSEANVELIEHFLDEWEEKAFVEVRTKEEDAKAYRCLEP
ncbi:MAG: hypothetical protein ABEJ02_01190 [Candidatus Paceibacteria bacterium]